ncbi:MAG: hypothetical protein EOL95_01690 [Bacteroidia bacterium]|nr:hypothetical protein [Bacteroidia bacterium]
MDKVLKIILVLAAICLIWLCYDSITTPIEFNKQRELREKKVVSRLVDIRRAETEFKNIKGDYTTNFDTLISFVKNSKAKIVLKEGVLTDKQLEEGLTEREAVKQGIIKRDTTYVSMLESLFGKDYPIDSIKYIPYSEQRQEFELAKAEIATGAAGIKVKVMEAKAPYSVYLNGLDKQELVNLIELTEKLERYPGLKFGDIQQSNNNAGNWE